MSLKRCNSISTVFTLPMHAVSTPQMTSEQRDTVDTVETTERKQSVNRKEQTTSNMDSNIKYEMKKRKSNRIKKYMVLFCIVLVSVVVSTVLAGYIGSKSVEKDIPDETSQELQKMPEREFLEMLYSNLTEIKSALQLVFRTLSTRKLRKINNRLSSIELRRGRWRRQKIWSQVHRFTKIDVITRTRTWKCFQIRMKLSPILLFLSR
uniref:Uncharacterized protein n=1 Tax=Magallana gigas TaxID=29159 RepID=A0A8W8NEQ1_MAGGI